MKNIFQEINQKIEKVMGNKANIEHAIVMK